MSRQIDIKALVSHVVRGDGINRCRICMGDTTEGQVFLGDTVMLDGEQPVTLSELLETITGVQMPMSGDLPVGLCSACSVSALRAADFRAVCRDAASKWDTALQLLSIVPDVANGGGTTLFAIVELDQMILINDCDRLTDAKTAAGRLNDKLKPKARPEAVSVTSIKHRCQCPDCGKKFVYPQQLYEHLKEATDFKRACYVCARIMSRDELVVHLSDEHNRKPYDCKKCPALLRSYNQYAQHLQKAHSRGSCTCGDCGRNFRSSNAFRAHVSIHTVKTCPGCDEVFRSQTCYLHHLKKCCNLDSRRKRYNGRVVEVKNRMSDKRVKVGLRGRMDKECICDYCNKKFAGKRFVSAHIQIVHTKNTHRPCVYCGRHLAAAHMTEHVKKHETVRLYKCDHCGIVLKTKLGYVQHLRLHSGERPYACQYCDETFSASSRRSEHIRKAHRSSGIVLKHACDRCPARFRLPYRLRKHVESVHNATNGAPLFACSKCHEKFISCRGLLLHHSRAHRQPSTRAKKAKELICKVYSEPVTNYYATGRT